MAPVLRLQAGPASGFRADIQGLRAIAVMLVVLCHAGVPLFGGGYVGVDVFFVISGFLITGWLVRRVERDGRVPFAAFYAARARRILPAAALVLVVTAIASRFFLNYVRALSALHDCVWATFFAANVHFARVGTDYFSRRPPAVARRKPDTGRPGPRHQLADDPLVRGSDSPQQTACAFTARPGAVAGHRFTHPAGSCRLGAGDPRAARPARRLDSARGAGRRNPPRPAPGRGRSATPDTGRGAGGLE